MVRLIFSLLISILLIGCGRNTKTDSSEIQEKLVNKNEFDKEKYDLVDLSEFGMPAQIQVPNKTVTNKAPEVIVNDASGVLKVSSGNKFRINISETDMDKDIVVSDLEGDLLYKNTITEDEDGFIKYTSELPDGSQVFTHFCAWININGSTYLVENDKTEVYSDHYLNRMIRSVKSIQLNNSI